MKTMSAALIAIIMTMTTGMTIITMGMIMITIMDMIMRTVTITGMPWRPPSMT
jgi:hypothetical protein